MKCDETSFEQATAWHEYYMRTRQLRLRDLAWAMRGSPEIELMDGSADSLVPLWAWAKKHTESGLPSVPDGGRPASAIFLGAEPGPQDRFAALGESLQEYLLAVVSRRRPEAEWAIAISAYKGDYRRHHTALRLENGLYFVSSGLGRQLWVHHSVGSRKPADTLFVSVTGDRHDGTIPTGSSILVPLLSEPQLPWDDPARVPPRASEIVGISPKAAKAVPVVSEQGESELIFAAIGTDVEQLERAKPLDEAAVAAVLDGLGFAPPEGLALDEVLRSPDAQLHHPTASILVDVFAHRRRLRALHLELHGTDAENGEVVAALTQLGMRLRARLASEDDWTNGHYE